MDDSVYKHFNGCYKNYKTYLDLGDKAYGKNDWEQAVWWFTIANFNCQRTLEGWDKLAMALHHTGNNEAAADAVRAALAYDMPDGRRQRLRKNLTVFDPKSVNSDPQYYDDFWASKPDMKSLEKIRIEKMAKMIYEDKTVLDIGSGPGWIVDYLKEGTKYMGVDFSKVARKMVEDRGGLSANSMEEVKENDWDVIILAEILEHIEDDVGFLKKAADKVREGGHLLVSVPRHKIMYDPAHVRDYTAEEFDEKLKLVGEITESLTLERWEIRKVKVK